MDQRTLYERIALSGSGPDYPSALVTRDAFVIEHIRKHFGERSPVVIAELSIGQGRMTTAILSSLPNARLTCAEIASEAIANVRADIETDARVKGRVPQFVTCNLDTDFERIPSAAFDVAIAMDVMEHVLDVFGFMENCGRILRRGGWLYLRVPNIAFLRHRIRLLMGRLPVTASWFGTPGKLTAWRERDGWDGGHLHLFTIPILRQLVEESGFEIETCCDPGTRLSTLRTAWPGLLFSNPLVVARRT